MRKAIRRGFLASLGHPLRDSGCTWLVSRPDVGKCQLVSLIGRPATQESGRHFFFFFECYPRVN